MHSSEASQLVEHNALVICIDDLRPKEWLGTKLKWFHFAHVRCRKSSFCGATEQGNHAIVTVANNLPGRVSRVN